MGDPFAENSVLNLKGKALKRAEQYEGDTLSYADALIVTNKPTSIQLQKKYSQLKETSFYVIPQAVEPIKSNSIQTKIKPENIRLMYAGIFYEHLREPYELFKSMEHLTGKCSLSIYGQADIYANKLPNIIFQGHYPNEHILEAYTKSDILVFIDNAFGFQTSGKIYELLSVKKPILFIYENNRSPTKKLVEGYDFIFLAKNNSLDITQNIQTIVDKNNVFNYDFDIDSISWKERARQYDIVLKDIQSGNK